MSESQLDAWRREFWDATATSDWGNCIILAEKILAVDPHDENTWIPFLSMLEALVQCDAEPLPLLRKYIEYTEKYMVLHQNTATYVIHAKALARLGDYYKSRSKMDEAVKIVCDIMEFAIERSETETDKDAVEYWKLLTARSVTHLVDMGGNHPQKPEDALLHYERCDTKSFTATDWMNRSDMILKWSGAQRHPEFYRMAIKYNIQALLKDPSCFGPRLYLGRVLMRIDPLTPDDVELLGILISEMEDYQEAKDYAGEIQEFKLKHQLRLSQLKGSHRSSSTDERHDA